jgi:hypothetical protein
MTGVGNRSSSGMRRRSHGMGGCAGSPAAVADSHPHRDVESEMGYSWGAASQSGNPPSGSERYRLAKKRLAPSEPHHLGTVHGG